MESKYNNQLSVRTHEQQEFRCRKCRCKTVHERSILRVWRCVECGTAYLGLGHHAEGGE